MSENCGHQKSACGMTRWKAELIGNFNKGSFFWYHLEGAYPFDQFFNEPLNDSFDEKGNDPDMKEKLGIGIVHSHDDHTDERI